MSAIENIIIIARDNSRVEFDNRITQVSVLIKEIAEEYPGSPIPMAMIDRGPLELIKRYCEVHNYDMPPPIDKPLQGSFEAAVSNKEKQFFRSINLQTVSVIVEAADMLAIDQLVRNCCAYIAHEFQTRHPDYLREIFGFPDHYSQMEAELRNNADWILED